MDFHEEAASIANFYVAFLSEEELTSLERQFPPVAQRELQDVGPVFPGNIMLRYELAGVSLSNLQER